MLAVDAHRIVIGGHSMGGWVTALTAPRHPEPLLILTANDNLASNVEPIINQMRSLGNKRVVVVHRATDHSWNDSRIALESAVIRWLQSLN